MLTRVGLVGRTNFPSSRMPSSVSGFLHNDKLPPPRLEIGARCLKKGLYGPIVAWVKYGKKRHHRTKH